MIYSNDEYSIAARAIRGDSGAYEMLLKKYESYFYKIAYLYTGNAHDAMDVVQESVFQGFIKIKHLRHPEKFLPWMNSIVVNQALQYRRKQKKYDYSGELSEIPDERAGSSEMKIDLNRALKKLRKAYRECIVLKYFYDKPVKEISLIMGASENTVKTYLSRGKKELKELLKEDYFED